MKNRTLIFFLILSFFAVFSAQAQRSKDDDTDIYIGVEYDVSTSLLYGPGHDIIFSWYDEDDWGDGAVAMQFRYTDFWGNSTLKIEPEDVDLNLDSYNFVSSESFVTPRHEMAFGLGGRVYRDTDKRKDIYLMCDLIYGSSVGVNRSVLNIRRRGDVVGHRFEEKKERGQYWAFTLGPLIRARLTDNLHINGKVQIGGGAENYRALKDGNWNPIWYARASVGAEFSF